MNKRYYSCHQKIRFDNNITIVSNHNAEIFFLNNTAKEIFLGYANKKTQEEIIDTICQINHIKDFKRIKEDVLNITEFMIEANIIYAE